LRGIRRFHRFGAGGEIGDIGKTAGGERKSLQILAADNSLVDDANQVDGLGGDGGSGRLDVDRLSGSNRFQGYSNFANRADGDRNIGLGRREPRRTHRHSVGARQNIVETKLATVFAGSFALHGGVDCLKYDLSGSNAGAREILYSPPQRASGILGTQRSGHNQSRRQRKNDLPQQAVPLVSKLIDCRHYAWEGVAAEQSSVRGELLPEVVDEMKAEPCTG